jgi:hypothetical protein
VLIIAPNPEAGEQDGHSLCPSLLSCVPRRAMVLAEGICRRFCASAFSARRRRVAHSVTTRSDPRTCGPLRVEPLKMRFERTVLASDDKTARIWDAAGGKEIAMLRGHQSLRSSSAGLNSHLCTVITLTPCINNSYVGKSLLLANSNKGY